MLKFTSKLPLIALCAGLLTISCQKETEVEELAVPQSHLKAKEATKKAMPHLNYSGTLRIMEKPELAENWRNVLINEAVEPSECAPTAFVDVQNQHLIPLLNDLVVLFGPSYIDIYYLYADLNFYMAYFDTSENQTFGPNGEYTQFIKKRKRELEKFWDMPGEITINGQHSSSLNDREKLADIYEIVGANVTSREEAYAAADQILYFNTFSDLLPESPFLSIDGFAVSFDLIVLGDGLVQMIAETGIDTQIVYTGILAHEWAHQIQFDNNYDWYPMGAENTRHTELEADFMASYYMTHKRGATYNWKRVAQFLELYFQIGDCQFESDGHHGTPAQRLAASQLGYELANGAHKQGHILSEQELHEYFMTNVGDLVN